MAIISFDVPQTQHIDWTGRLALRGDAVRTGLRDIAPILAGIFPGAVAVGAAVADSQVSNFVGWLGAPVIFAGSAHIAAISVLGVGGSALAALGTALAVNSRTAVYSAALSRPFSAQPLWFRLLAPYFLIDQLFALATGRMTEGRDEAWLRSYYLAAGIAVWLLWVPAVALGVGIGPVLPRGVPIDFALPALVVGLLVPALRGRPNLSAAVVAAAVSVAIGSTVPGVGFLIGGLAGMGVAMAMDGGPR
jgi:predicted branched-subunit amino acid permease